MSASPLASKVVTRRAAASRANAAILMGSSSESEREDDSEWNTTRSKAGLSRKKIVKGYSTGNILEQERDIDMERRRSSPIKKYSVKKKRRAAAQAGDGDTTASDDVAPSNGNAVESVSAPIRPRPKPKSKSKVSGSKATKSKDAKPKLDLDLSMLGDDEESDLTPLSSPLDPPKAAASSPARTVSSRPVRSHPMFSAVSKTRKEKDISASKQPLWDANEVGDDWKLSGLGKYVWVRLDGKDSGTAGVFNAQISGSGKETLWWPAKVVRYFLSFGNIRIWTNLSLSRLILVNSNRQSRSGSTGTTGAHWWSTNHLVKTSAHG